MISKLTVKNKSWGWFLFPLLSPEVAKLPSGHQLDGAIELKAYLLKHKHHEFSEALVRTMFAYALGRSPEWTDKAEIDRLTKTFTASGHKLNVLISAIVNSRSFRER